MQRLGELDLKALICFRALASSSINCANLIELNQLVTFMRFFLMTSPPSLIDNVEKDTTLNCQCVSIQP